MSFMAFANSGRFRENLISTYKPTEGSDVLFHGQFHKRANSYIIYSLNNLILTNPWSRVNYNNNTQLNNPTGEPDTTAQDSTAQESTSQDATALGSTAQNTSALAGTGRYDALFKIRWTLRHNLIFSVI